MKYVLPLLLLTFGLLTGCGGEEKTSEKQSTTDKKEQAPPARRAGPPVTLEIGSGDNMLYDKSLLRAESGQEITLKLTHEGELAKASMGHNWVLLKEGTDVTSFIMKALKAQENDYIPESDKIIAHTEMIGGGESTEVTFTAPAPGSYAYICTFPGHYTMMKGVLIVK